MIVIHLFIIHYRLYSVPALKFIIMEIVFQTWHDLIKDAFGSDHMHADIRSPAISVFQFKIQII